MKNPKNVEVRTCVNVHMLKEITALFIYLFIYFPQKKFREKMQKKGLPHIEAEGKGEDVPTRGASPLF
jgi:hypothetical protein